jgi:hypothetical protein
MPVLQKCFLHTPARSPAEVEEYVSQHREEGEQLDFKAIAWEKSLEAAKDVAAFANHRGGDIIIGINDKGDRADGWNPIPNADIRNTISKIRDWLIYHIRPQEVAEIVDIEPVVSPQSGSSVLVVAIPPFHQLVGVEYREGDKLTFQFPIRTGRRTRWLTFDEIMTRTSTSTRGTYIKLRGLVDAYGMGAVPLIGFISPVLVAVADERLPLSVVDGGIHCCFDALTPDVLSVRMRGSTGFMSGVSVPPEYKLAIPLEFIRAVWKDQKLLTEGEHIFIALDVNLIWRGLYWELVTGSFI